MVCIQFALLSLIQRETYQLTRECCVSHSIFYVPQTVYFLHFFVDTTDVQNVTAVPIKSANDVNTVMIQCYFVNGSTAEGCMVVLVGELGNTTENLTRENPYRTINTSLPLSCYTGVFGYDIESDGSVGTLPVPGVISNAHNTIMICDLPVTESSKYDNKYQLF